MTNPLPIQPVKIHCPPPRRDVLSRERLNGWLDRAAVGRVVLIVAEAGYGKTTLLADWAHHSGRMTAWYRLESDDRDWLTFIRHLVATGRELDPEFGSDTLGLLLALGPGGPTRGELITSIAREMADFGSRSERGLTLIFDDFHVVDRCSDTDPIVRALIDRTGPGFSIVLATRSAPRLPMGKLRARGGVDSLDDQDLCFDVGETDRLFRDAYRLPLQADVIASLCDRTEGWAALLTLVRTSLDERGGPDPRALVAQLSASGGDLYDFLAEEVLAGLPPDLQRFLMRVSVLTAVDVGTAVLVDDRPADDVAATILHCETLGLLTRPDRESPHRFHPLVREFLVTRLALEIGAAAVRDLHRSIGRQLASVDWQGSAWHFVQGEDGGSAASVIDGAIEDIIASGAFRQVSPFLEPSAGDPMRPTALVLRSRIALDGGNGTKATGVARHAVGAAGEGRWAGTALLNLASILSVGGFDDEAVDTAAIALSSNLSVQQRCIAQAIVTVREASQEGDLEAIADSLRELAVLQEGQHLRRYAGISRLNLAATMLWLGETETALREADRAELALGGRESPSVERVAATATRAIALSQLGRLTEATAILTGVTMPSPLARDEISLESARIHSDFGSIEDALASLAQVEVDRLSGGYRAAWRLVRGVVAMREHDIATASSMCDLLQDHGSTDAAGKMRAQLLRTRVALAIPGGDPVDHARELDRIATAQNSRPGRYLAAILGRLAIGDRIAGEVERVGPTDQFCLVTCRRGACRRPRQALDQRDRSGAGGGTDPAQQMAVGLALTRCSQVRDRVSTVPRSWPKSAGRQTRPLLRAVSRYEEDRCAPTHLQSRNDSPLRSDLRDLGPVDIRPRWRLDPPRPCDGRCWPSCASCRRGAHGGDEGRGPRGIMAGPGP